MQVILAKTAGFCYGVERAVHMAEVAAREGGCVMLGSIIHNDRVITALEALGARQADSPQQVRPGETVIIRAHGETREALRVLEERGAQIMDATCPHVLRIHRLVEQAARAGRTPIIIGEAHHPEVMAAASRCERSVVLENTAELADWVAADPARKDMDLLVTAQTTCIRSIWEECVKFLKKQCTNAEIFDTICDATQKRQSEAANIAGRADVMVVVGDRKSANTRHLAEICSTRCARVYQIEGPEELRVGFLNGCSVAGLTAGASTPAGIIKEVYATMSEEIKNMEATEESFEEMLEKSFKTLNTGEKVTGIVTAIGPTEVQVDLGCKQAGYISVDELSADPNVKPEDVVKVGDEIETYIIRVNDVEGYAMLSKKRLDAVKVWEDIEKAREDKTTLEGKVTEENKGGLVANVKGVRVFIPASQAVANRGDDLEALKGQDVQFRIIEVNRQRRRAVGSIRSVLREQRKAAQAKFWESVEEGQEFTGTVKSLTNFGAFVDLGGVDGMIHISELSWNRIKHPSEVVSVGDTVQVYVKSLDRENGKISLGYKKKEDNPWEILKNEYPVGTVCDATVVGMTTFGAFAKILPGIDGLIHISQIADRRIEKPQDVLKVGDVVKVKITDIDFDKKRVSLSIRALLEDQGEDASEE